MKWLRFDVSEIFKVVKYEMKDVFFVDIAIIPYLYLIIVKFIRSLGPGMSVLCQLRFNYIFVVATLYQRQIRRYMLKASATQLYLQ